MESKAQLDGDEIDLFEVIETLLSEKITLTVFVAISLTLGGLYIFMNEPKYNTTAEYKIELQPPRIEIERINSDLSWFVERADIFALWKANSPGTILGYDFIDQKKFIEGSAFSIKEDTRFLVVSEGRIQIRSNDLKLIEETMDYVKFANSQMEASYVNLSSREMDRFGSVLDKNFGDLASSDYFLTFNTFHEHRLFLEFVANGRQVIKIDRPLPPRKTSASNRLILSLSLIFGVILGGLFLLIKKSNAMRKLRLAQMQT